MVIMSVLKLLVNCFAREIDKTKQLWKVQKFPDFCLLGFLCRSDVKAPLSNFVSSGS